MFRNIKKHSYHVSNMKIVLKFISVIKENVSQDLYFFPDSKPSGPLINRLKYFEFFFDFEIFKFLRNSAVESISAACITLLSQSPQCTSHPTVNLCGVMHATRTISAVCITLWSHAFQILKKKNSAVCITPPSQSPRCASHRRVNLHGWHYTAKSVSMVCIIPLNQTLGCAS